MTGYVRLRSLDIIDGLTRHNTYEDIYRDIPPIAEDELDPFIDPRPRRLSSQIDENLQPGNDESNDADEDDPVFAEYSGKSKERRPSGVLPRSYDDLKSLRSKVEQSRKKHGTSSKAKGISGKEANKSLAKTQAFDPRRNPDFAELSKKLADIAESDEEEEEEEDSNTKVVFTTGYDEDDPDNVNDSEQEESTGSFSNNNSRRDSWSGLRSNIKKECFIKRRLKKKPTKGGYQLEAVSSNGQMNVYLSSERYHQTFEDDFDDLLDVIKRSHLKYCTEVEQPAIITNDNTRRAVSI